MQRPSRSRPFGAHTMGRRHNWPFVRTAGVPLAPVTNSLQRDSAPTTLLPSWRWCLGETDRFRDTYASSGRSTVAASIGPSHCTPSPIVPPALAELSGSADRNWLEPQVALGSLLFPRPPLTSPRRRIERVKQEVEERLRPRRPAASGPE